MTALKPLQPQPSRAAAPVNPAPVTSPSTASEPDGGLGAPPALNLAPLNLAPPPDLSGLSAAFAAAAGQPPVGVPTVADLPTPEQIADALAGLPPLPPLLLLPP